jgi:hypothetical protein
MSKRDKKPANRSEMIVLCPDGTKRDRHPLEADTYSRQVDHVTFLMATGQWQSTTMIHVSEDWGISVALAGRIASEAKRRLASYGDKDATVELVRVMSTQWLMEGGSDRVKAAELLLKTHGAVGPGRESTSNAAGLNDEQLARRAIVQLVANDMTRELMRSELAAWDQKHPLSTSTAITVVSCTPNELPDSATAVPPAGAEDGPGSTTFDPHMGGSPTVNHQPEESETE